MGDFTLTSLDAARREPGYIGWDQNGPIFAAPEDLRFAAAAAGPSWWPWADNRVQRAPEDGGSILDGFPGKGLWHTTETDGWPGYGSGYFPHLTVAASGGRFYARQHIPFGRAARALRNEAGGVQTNRITRCQVEIVGRADLVDERGLDPAMEDGLAELAQWLEAEWGVPRACTVRFLPYPLSYGATEVRLAGGAWERYTGWLGHQHAAENAHGDPGALDWRRILRPEEDDMTKDELKALIPSIAAAVAEELRPDLKRYGAASRLLVKQPDHPHVYAVEGSRLVHLQDATRYFAYSGGRGVAEAVVVLDPDDGIWDLPISGEVPWATG